MLALALTAVDLLSGAIGGLLGATVAGLAALIVGWRQRQSDRGAQLAAAIGRLSAAVGSLYLVTSTFRAVHERLRGRGQPSESDAQDLGAKLSHHLVRATAAHTEVMILADHQPTIDLAQQALDVALQLSDLVQAANPAVDDWERVRKRMTDVTIALKYDARDAVPRGLIRRRRSRRHTVDLRMRDP